MGPNSSKSTANVPPPSVLFRALKELFQDGDFPYPFQQIFNFTLGILDKIFVFLLFIFSLGISSSVNSEVENRNSRVIKGAPLQSLFAQFCLHALWFGNCNIRGWFLHKESDLQFFFSYMI
jgi:Rab3 GTPase-activating protein catalytic subunit